MLFLSLFFGELVVLFFLSRLVTITISQLLFAFTKSSKWTLYLFSLLFLPGTFFHELAHFLMAAILLVPVGNIELMPVLRGNDVKLGSVPVARVDIFRMTLIGAAPFFLGTAAIIGLLFFFGRTTSTWWQIALLVYGVFEIGNTMFSSKKDLEGSTLLLLFVVAIVGALYFLKVDVLSYIEQSIIFFNLTPLFKLGSTLLVLPLLLDTLCIIVGKLLLRFLFRVV